MSISQRRQITIVTTSFPISGDGSEAAGSFVLDLAHEMITQNISVHIVAPGVKYEVSEINQFIHVYRFPAPKKAISTLKPWILNDLIWLIRIIYSGKMVLKYAAKDSTLIIALWALPCGEWARQVAKQLNTPYSVWMLGSDIWSLKKIPLVKYLLAYVIQNAKHAYADGYQLAKDATEISDRKIEFLPTTREIDCSLSVSAPNQKPPFSLVFIGRWHINKGIDILLDSLEILTRDDWKLIKTIEIYGGGPLHQLVYQKVEKLKKNGAPIILGGYLNKTKSISVIQQADYILIPSRIESIPLIFSDSMKLNRPVICMPTGDLPKLLSEGNCGILSTEISAIAFASAIQNALRKSPISYSQGVKKQAEKFILSNIVKRLINNE